LGRNHSKDKQICNYQQIIHEAEWSGTERNGMERSVGEFTLIIREKDQDRESHEKLSQAEHAIVELIEWQMELNVWRDREINKLTIIIEGLEQ
jgi:hypothetical protein